MIPLLTLTALGATIGGAIVLLLFAFATVMRFRDPMGPGAAITFGVLAGVIFYGACVIMGRLLL